MNIKLERELTTEPCLEPIAMTKEDVSLATQWKTTSAVYVTGRQEGDCTQLGNCSDGEDPPSDLGDWTIICWDPVRKTFTWLVPADAQDHDFYTLNLTDIRAELAKHKDELFRLLTNFDLAEDRWLKYPLFGDVRLGVKKTGATVELTRLGAGIEPLTWTDPFLNRILTVGYAPDTALIGTITSLDP